jgi:hypothetical protein
MMLFAVNMPSLYFCLSAPLEYPTVNASAIIVHVGRMELALTRAPIDKSDQ